MGKGSLEALQKFASREAARIGLTVDAVVQASDMERFQSFAGQRTLAVVPLGTAAKALCNYLDQKASQPEQTSAIVLVPREASQLCAPLLRPTCVRNHASSFVRAEFAATRGLHLTPDPCTVQLAGNKQMIAKAQHPEYALQSENARCRLGTWPESSDKGHMLSAVQAWRHLSAGPKQGCAQPFLARIRESTGASSKLHKMGRLTPMQQSKLSVQFDWTPAVETAFQWRRGALPTHAMLHLPNVANTSPFPQITA